MQHTGSSLTSALQQLRGMQDTAVTPISQMRLLRPKESAQLGAQWGEPSSGVRLITACASIAFPSCTNCFGCRRVGVWASSAEQTVSEEHGGNPVTLEAGFPPWGSHSLVGTPRPPQVPTVCSTLHSVLEAQWDPPHTHTKFCP